MQASPRLCIHVIIVIKCLPICLDVKCDMVRTNLDSYASFMYKNLSSGTVKMY